jgi:hypothetical protein
MYLTAWETLSQVTTAMPQTLGFLLMAVAGLIVSVVILRSQSFGKLAGPGKAVGYMGIVGFVTTVANYVSWIIAPSIAAVLMPLNGLLWLIWWLIISVGLFELAKATPAEDTASTVG